MHKHNKIFAILLSWITYTTQSHRLLTIKKKRMIDKLKYQNFLGQWLSAKAVGWPQNRVLLLFFDNI